MPSSGVQTCARSEEHTSELQSHDNLVCRLLLEKKTQVTLAPAQVLYHQSQTTGIRTRTTTAITQLNSHYSHFRRSSSAWMAAVLGFFLMILLPPRSTLFPYTTLFR